MPALRHGHTARGQVSAEYQAWANMVARCTNPSVPNYKRYGARGITVCAAWRESFDAFLRDVGPRPGPAFSLERVRNNEGYEPGNVRWATAPEQHRNRRSNFMVTHAGETLCVTDWARRFGVDPSLLSRRLRRGLPLLDAVQPQPRGGHRPKGSVVAWRRAPQQS